MRNTTTIAERDIPIQAGEVSTVYFSSGRGGESEAGEWEFWTIFNSHLGSTARCRLGSDPGERFRIMEGASGYESHWQIASSSIGVRPATRNEVIGWLNSHVKDAQFAESCRLGSKSLQVVRASNGVAFELRD
jgi:hypothetical protein